MELEGWAKFFVSFIMVSKIIQRELRRSKKNSTEVVGRDSENETFNTELGTTLPEKVLAEPEARSRHGTFVKNELCRRQVIASTNSNFCRK